VAAANELEMRCPAARLVGERDGAPLVECHVEKSLIGVRENPNTVVNFCAGCYTDCPSWRAEKERTWARRLGPLVTGEVRECR
jgi:hypothetical protein